jgi:hypothetical protein
MLFVLFTILQKILQLRGEPQASENTLIFLSLGQRLHFLFYNQNVKTFFGVLTQYFVHRIVSIESLFFAKKYSLL